MLVECTSEELAQFSYLYWVVWYNKNGVLHGKLGRSMVEISKWIYRLAGDFLRVMTKQGGDNRSNKLGVRWEKP